MGELSNFLGSPKKVEIHGKEIEIVPLKVKDLKRFTKTNPTPEESEKLAREIIKLSIPDTTDEEVENLPMEVFMKLTEEINKLNGFTDENADKITRLRKLKTQNTV